MKSISGLGKNSLVSLLAFEDGEKSKFVVISDKGHERVLDNNKFVRTNRLGKPQLLMPSFKGDVHKVVGAVKVKDKNEVFNCNVYLSDQTIYNLVIEDLKLTDISRYAKKNMQIPARTFVENVYEEEIEQISKQTKSYYVPKVQVEDEEQDNDEEVYTLVEENEPEVVEEESIETAEEEVQLVEEEKPAEEIAPVEQPKKAKSKSQSKKKAEDDSGSFEQINLFDDLD